MNLPKKIVMFNWLSLRVIKLQLLKYFILQYSIKNDLILLVYVEKKKIDLQREKKNKYYTTIKPIALSLKSHKPIYIIYVIRQMHGI